jgi:hypothetical protein
MVMIDSFGGAASPLIRHNGPAGIRRRPSRAAGACAHGAHALVVQDDKGASQ